MATLSTANISAKDQKIRDSVKKYFVSQDLLHNTDDVEETVIIDTAAPGTQATRKRIEDLWLVFLEEKGFERKWDSKGPTIGMYTDI
jgi:hypothetical protein